MGSLKTLGVLFTRNLKIDMYNYDFLLSTKFQL